MKPIVTSVEELYDRKDGTGEVILDENIKGPADCKIIIRNS